MDHLCKRNRDLIITATQLRSLMQWRNLQDSLQADEPRMGSHEFNILARSMLTLEIFFEKIFHHFVVPNIFIDAMHFIQLG